MHVPEKMQLSSAVIGSLNLRRSAGHQLYLQFNDKNGCLEIKGINVKTRSVPGEYKIICSEIKSVGDLSDTEVSVGMKEGKTITLGLRDEKDAVLLVKELEYVTGITAYTARCY